MSGENADVGRMVRAARKAAGLTQARLARRAGTTQSVVSRLESGEQDGTAISTVRAVARALGKRLVVEMVDVERGGGK